jgi:hypothetical protein
MISADHNRYMGANPFRHRIGISSVADQIAQANDLVVFARGGLKDGLQPLPVCVYIAKN